MWGHVFAALLVGLGLVAGAVLVFTTRVVLSAKSFALRITLTVMIQLGATFIAVFLALFAPIVFAFMYGKR